MDEHVFERYDVNKVYIEEFTNQLYEQELTVRNYDAVCYAIYFALKFGFEINSLSAQIAIDSDSCIFKLLAFLYFKKVNNKDEKKLLRDYALQLKRNDEDLNRNWLFVYESLPKSDLPGDWEKMKTDMISFIRPEFQV